MNARQHIGNQRAGQLMNERAEGGILLRRAPHRGKGPDGIRAVMNRLHLQDGKIVRQTVIPKVVAEGPFRQRAPGIDRSRNDEIGFCRHRQAVGRRHQRDTAAAKQAGKGQLRHPLRQRHHCRHIEAGRPTNKDIDPQRFTATQSLGVVNTDAAVDLVMQARFLIGLVAIAGDLHPVHAEVAMAPAGAGGIF